MTRVLLDTNICIELLRGRGQTAFDRLCRLGQDEAGISSITLAELHYGAARTRRPAHHTQMLAEFCAPLAILPFDSGACEASGRLRAALESDGRPIGPLDTLIAAHALSLDLVLVTNNEREFRRVSGLRVENWLKE